MLIKSKTTLTGATDTLSWLFLGNAYFLFPSCSWPSCIWVLEDLLISDRSDFWRDNCGICFQNANTIAHL